MISNEMTLGFSCNLQVIPSTMKLQMILRKWYELKHMFVVVGNFGSFIVTKCCTIIQE